MTVSPAAQESIPAWMLITAPVLSGLTYQTRAHELPTRSSEINTAKLSVLRIRTPPVVYRTAEYGGANDLWIFAKPD